MTPIEAAAIDYIQKRRLKQQLKRDRWHSACTGLTSGRGSCVTRGYDEVACRYVLKARVDPDWCEACKRSHQLSMELPSVAARCGAALRNLQRIVVKETTP